MPGVQSLNTRKVGTQYICFKCRHVYQEPVQLTTCNHRFCKSCIPSLPSGSTIHCYQCNQPVSNSQLRNDSDFAKVLETITVECSLCTWTGLLREYTTHRDQEHPSFTCEECNERFSSAQAFSSHRESQCRAVLITCPLNRFGCFQPMSRSQLKHHYYTPQHQEALGRVIDQIKKSSIAPATTDNNPMDHSQEDSESLSDLTDLMSDALKAMQDDNQHVQRGLSQSSHFLQDASQRSASLKLAVEEINNFQAATKSNLHVLEQEALLLSEQVDDFQCASYDGTLIWKITGFREKFRDAESERQTSVYSPPFYSSTTGYKMRARAYLNGDGNARRTHMSLFFVLMRGPFDSLLKFPFDYKVTFCLYDQTPAQRHIVDSFRPDVRSNSFQRAKSTMNIASGIPKFVPINMIDREDSPYVRNDTMFIKIMVDFENIPKTSLPFIIKLDPGLPAHVQQDMIRKHVEGTTQQQQSQSDQS